MLDFNNYTGEMRHNLPSMNVVIGIPTMGSVDTKTTESLFRLNRGNNKVALLTTEYSLIYDARERIIHKALENSATDYVLFIDSDIVFEPDTLLKLLKTARIYKDSIISGAYPYKYEKANVVGFDLYGKEIPAVSSTKDNYILASSIGMGMCLIPRKILEDIVKEYEGSGIFHPFSGMGEDISFCRRVTSNGYKIIVDRAITCGHVGKKVYEVGE